MMKHYIPIETNMMDNDAVCALINKYGMRGYGMYMAIIIELRKHNNYSCGVDTLRMLARKCKVKFAFLLSVITDFGLFDVEETEDGKIQISSEYVNRVMLPYDEKTLRCKESGARGAKKRWETVKAENDSNPIAIEENRIEKNTASEELHSSSAEETVAAADALEFSIRHKPDDEVCRQVVGALLEVQQENQEVRKLKAWGLEAPVLEGRILQPRVQRSGTLGCENTHKWSAGGTTYGHVSCFQHSKTRGCIYPRFRFATPGAELYVLPGLGPPAPKLSALRSKQIRIALKTNKDSEQNK